MKLTKGKVPESCPFTAEQVLDPSYWPKSERSA